MLTKYSKENLLMCGISGIVANNGGVNGEIFARAINAMATEVAVTKAIYTVLMAAAFLTQEETTPYLSARLYAHFRY